MVSIVSVFLSRGRVPCTAPWHRFLCAESQLPRTCSNLFNLDLCPVGTPLKLVNYVARNVGKAGGRLLTEMSSCLRNLFKLFQLPLSVVCCSRYLVTSLIQNLTLKVTQKAIQKVNLKVSGCMLNYKNLWL